MPFKRELYPKDWNEISARIRHERAKDKCERCGVPNHAVGARDRFGKWHDEDSIHSLQSDCGEALFCGEFPHMVKIILTVAHLDQNPANNDEKNLAALCQRCHLNHDRPFNMPKIRATWRRKHIEHIESCIKESGQLALWR